MRASFTAALALFLGIQGAAAAQRFSLTCNDLSLDGTVLKAKCNNKDQTPVSTSIDLNSILNFQNGQFQWADNATGFAGICSSCTLYRDYDPRETKYWGYPFQLRQAMKCTCAGAQASIVLDQEIGNDNGKLYTTLW